MPTEVPNLYDHNMPRVMRRRGLTLYTRDPQTDIWETRDGRKFKLERHGGSRLDMQEIQLAPMENLPPTTPSTPQEVSA